MRFIATAGVVPQFYLGASGKVHQKFPDGAETKTKEAVDLDANPIILSTSAGVGIIWQVSRKFSLRLQPTFKYALVSINKGNFIHEYPWTFGLNTTVFFGN